MGTVIVCDVCGGTVDDVSYGPLTVEGRLCVGQIVRRIDVGDVCTKCLRKEYYGIARQMFESMQIKRKAAQREVSS